MPGKRALPRGWKRGIRTGAAMCLGVALLAGPATALADGAQVSIGFGDLGGVSWARPAITVMAAQGVLRGVGPGRFDPSAPTTRAELAVVLGRLLRWRTAAATGGQPPFADQGNIPGWARGYVDLAAAKGLLRGVGGNRFAPGLSVTWAEASVLLARTFNFPLVTGPTEATDLAALPHGQGTPAWAREGVARDVAAGLYRGAMAARYRANGPIPRAALAVLLKRAEQARPSVVAATGAMLSGPVTAVGPSSLTIQTPAGPQTVTLLQGAQVFLNGVAATLAQVTVGDSATVALQGGQGGAVDASNAALPGGGTTVTGTLVGLSGTSLVLSTASGQATYPLAPGATVTLNGQPIAGASLVAGGSLDVSLNAQGQAASVAETQATPAGGGTIVGLAQASGGVSVITVFLPAASGGTVSSYTLPAAAALTLNGAASTPPSLQIGDQVNLTLNASGQLAALAATAPAGGQAVSGPLSSVANGQIVVVTGPGTTNSVPAGPAPVAVSGGQVVSVAGLAAGTAVEVIAGAGGPGSALVIVN